jgi:hypothetical protein
MGVAMPLPDTPDASERRPYLQDVVGVRPGYAPTQSGLISQVLRKGWMVVAPGLLLALDLKYGAYSPLFGLPALIRGFFINAKFTWR